MTAAPRRVAVRLEADWEFRRREHGRWLFVQPMGQACVEPRARGRK